MFSCFDSLFYEYCQLESTLKKNTVLAKPEAEITSFAALIIILGSGLVLISNPCESSVHVAIGYVILLCTLAVLTRMAVGQKRKPSVQQYSDHMLEVVKLLENHKIFPNDSEKIKALIEFSADIMERRNPLSDIKKALTIAGSVIAVVWSILANGLNSYADLNEYILELLIVALCILGCCLMLVVIYNAILFLLFPQRKKYQQLIDDLKQIAIFYTTS